MFHFQLRVCHKLTAKLKREVVLGSSCLEDPAPFIAVIHFSFDLLTLDSERSSLSPLTNCFFPKMLQKLKMMTAHELSLDDLQI